MEDPPAPERPTADRSDGVREPVRNGIGLDGKRKHQRVREGAPGCQPVGTGRLCVQSLSTFANGWATHQLGDVTRGLIYIHSRGMVHGDIKGVRC